MELRVDDFGCVPDGRVLERVTIATDSTVLTSPDGGLRAADVDKNIAIPGAADLDATIASLANRTEVKNASMTAGSNVLTAIFTTDQEERFRKNLHTGRRIQGPGKVGKGWESVGWAENLITTWVWDGAPPVWSNEAPLGRAIHQDRAVPRSFVARAVCHVQSVHLQEPAAAGPDRVGGHRSRAGRGRLP
ncbi:MAG: hypothetical protein ACRDRQ_23960 [Pseudonocardiaceae bacterium]